VEVEELLTQRDGLTAELHKLQENLIDSQVMISSTPALS
jgi:hypothetical protein